MLLYIIEYYSGLNKEILPFANTVVRTVMPYCEISQVTEEKNTD